MSSDQFSPKAWPKEARIIAFVFAIFLSLGALWYFRVAIGPLAIAALLAYVMSPLVDYIERRTRLSHTGSVLVVYFITLLILLAIPAILTPIVYNQIQRMNLDVAAMIQTYDDFVDAPIYILQWTFYPKQFLPLIPETPANLLNPLAEFTLHAFETVSTNVIWVLVTFVTIFYMLKDGYRLVPWLIRIAPPAYQDDARHLYLQLRRVWSDYLRSQLIFMFIVGLMDSVVWLAIGLPGAVFLGFLTGLTSFVHEIGAVISGVLSVSVALLLGSHFLPLSNFWFAVLVLILYLILTALKNVWVRPAVVGRHVHLHSGIVFVIILAALMTSGALAAFVAVPVFVSLLIVGRYLRRRILGLPPFPEDDDPNSYFFVNFPDDFDTLPDNTDSTETI
jgi:predicted PurR-regulated permease PerM